MASFVFDQVKEFAITGSLNFDSSSVGDGYYRIALMVGDIVDDPEGFSNKKLWSEVSQYEIIQPNLNYNHDGYPGRPVDGKPGNALRGVGIADIPNGGIDNLLDKVAYADNINYNVSTIDADCMIIMRINTTIPNDYDLITAIDIRNAGQSVRSNNGVFSLLLDLSNGGFLTVK